MHLVREIMFTSEVKALLAILRPTLIYHAADPHNGYGPNRFWRLARSREPIRLFGKGDERRDHKVTEGDAATRRVERAVAVVRHWGDGTTPRHDRDRLTAAAPQWPPLSI